MQGAVFAFHRTQAPACSSPTRNAAPRETDLRQGVEPLRGALLPMRPARSRAPRMQRRLSPLRGSPAPRREPSGNHLRDSRARKMRQRPQAAGSHERDAPAAKPDRKFLPLPWHGALLKSAEGRRHSLPGSGRLFVRKTQRRPQALRPKDTASAAGSLPERRSGRRRSARKTRPRAPAAFLSASVRPKTDRSPPRRTPPPALGGGRRFR